LGQEKSPILKSHAVENQAVPASKIRFVAVKDGVYKGGEIYVHSAFTPNGDGKNDVLKAIPVGIKKFLYFSIYNRWGQRIFFTT